MVLSVFAAVPMTAGAATVSYVKVTTAPDDWSGDYLIVFEDEEGNKAFNGSADELDSSSNYIDVTSSGGEIESNAATDAAKITIAQIDGGYSIATATGAYIGGVSGQNKLDFRDEAILNTISLEDDSAKIVSNTSTLRFNTTWDGFRYYKTVSQKPVQLYKLTGGSAPTTYTVTWKNDDGTTLETDTKVFYGTTPEYNGETPTKPEDAQYVYTFSGWTDGTNTYGPTDVLPAVTGDAVYTAAFTPKDIFVINNGVLTAYNGDKSALKNLTIPEEVTEIGGSVFINCTNLESVNLNNVVKVGGDAFFGCTKLSSVIGSKLKYVGYRSFCTTTASLRTLTLRSGNNGADKKGTDSMFVTTAMVDAGNPTWYFYTVVRKGDDGNDFHYTAFNQTFLVEKGVEPFIESDYEEQQTSASGVNKSAIIYITIDDENKTIKVKSNESNVSGYEPGTKILVDGVEYTIVEDIKYTVTWKNEDGTVLKTDENVEEGATPEYNGETPTKPEDAQYVYTFSGWTDGTTAYAPGDAFPAATADAEYTATFTAVKKHVFAAHSISLGGDIGVNFYVDPAVAGVDAANAESATVKFSFDKHTFTVNLKEIKPDENGWYKATCNIPAAYMAHKIHAEVYIDGEKLDETDDYSVQDYAETILADPAKYDSEKPEKLAVLVKEMLNYGAKAQTVFSGQMNAAAEYDEIEGYSMADVTAEMIQAAIDSNPANEGKTASDMSTVQPESGAQYRTTSLVFLSQSTLRHYFAVPGGSADPSAYDGNQQNYYYYVEKTNISAKELDDLQEFTVNGVTFYYSALDYAKAVVESNMADSAKDLAKSVYLYNQAANNYFHVHTPGTAVRENEVASSCSAEGSYDEVIYCTECHEELSRETKTIDRHAHPIEAVSEVPSTHEAAGVQAHYVCTECGKLFTDAQGSSETTDDALIIPRNNNVKLDELTGDITLLDGDIVTGTLEGNKKISVAAGATITLKDANITLDGSAGYAAITPLGDATILLEGENSVKGGNFHAGIFAPNGYTLTIDGTGSLTAASSNNAAGIGGSYTTSGNIVINGGTINATGAYGSAGIGSAHQHNCGSITINGGNITATGNSTAGAGIGSSHKGTCGIITINGGTITATGGTGSAGIGASYNGNCGDITINNTVTKVSAQRGGYGPSTIGKGYGSSTCGTVTIGGEVVTTGTSPNPYVYEP